jgi:hypothetical protein
MKILYDHNIENEFSAEYFFEKHYVYKELCKIKKNKATGCDLIFLVIYSEAATFLAEP